MLPMKKDSKQVEVDYRTLSDSSSLSVEVSLCHLSLCGLIKALMRLGYELE